MKELHIRVPEEVAVWLRVEGATSGRRVSGVVADMVRYFMERNKEKKRQDQAELRKWHGWREKDEPGAE